MSIHPLAVIHPNAVVADDVKIGPFCVVEDNVTIGSGCVLEPRCTIRSRTALGSDNHIFENAVIGGQPQHAHMPENTGSVVLGSRNVIRENVTIHSALEQDAVTEVGSDCLFMVCSHIAHDCKIGNRVILTNNSLLAGHVTVGDGAYFGGAAAVHQFCRIGTLAMVGGMARVVKDIPPYVTVDGQSSFIVGLNQVGLRRAGFGLEGLRNLKAAYRALYRSGNPWIEVLETLKKEFGEGPAAKLYEFCSTSKRGVCPERRMPPGATIKLRTPNSVREINTKAG